MSRTPAPLTRRELLKRGALAGVGALWVSPVVQSVGMGRAYAAATSPECVIYCMVWTPSIGGAPSRWDPIADELCLPCPDGSVAGLPLNVDAEFSVNETDDSYTVIFPDSYELVKPNTPDELVDASAALRRGQTANDCNFDYDEGMGPLPNTTQLVFGNLDKAPANGDRIELVVKTCS